MGIGAGEWRATQASVTRSLLCRPRSERHSRRTSTVVIGGHGIPERACGGLGGQGVRALSRVGEVVLGGQRDRGARQCGHEHALEVLRHQDARSHSAAEPGRSGEDRSGGDRSRGSGSGGAGGHAAAARSGRLRTERGGGSSRSLQGLLQEIRPALWHPHGALPGVLQPDRGAHLCAPPRSRTGHQGQRLVRRQGRGGLRVDRARAELRGCDPRAQGVRRRRGCDRHRGEDRRRGDEHPGDVRR